VNTYPTNALAIESLAAPFTGGTVHYLVATYDGSKVQAGVKLYIDGVITTSTPDTITLTGASNNTVNPFIGARKDGSVPIGTSVIAYTRIYNRVLSQTDITNYYLAGAR
jgi:hypothetical protein